MRYPWMLLLWLCLLTPGLRAQEYLTPLEQGVIREVNLLRTQPAQYIAILEKEKGYYQGNLVVRPGMPRIQMQETSAAVDEAVEALKKQAPLEALAPSAGLTLAARDHVTDQGRTGETGHRGSDASMPADRMNRYGSGVGGENVAYGYDDARLIVIQLLVDDGVPNRGHRTNLLRPEFRFIGVACGTHPQMRAACVMDMAITYSDAPDAAQKASAALRGATSNAASGTNPPKTPEAGNPIDLAKAVANRYFSAAASSDRVGWNGTLSRNLAPQHTALWLQAQEANRQGFKFSYARADQASPDRVRLWFLKRDAKGRLSPNGVALTMIKEAGQWKVDAVDN